MTKLNRTDSAAMTQFLPFKVVDLYYLIWTEKAACASQREVSHIKVTGIP